MEGEKEGKDGKGGWENGRERIGVSEKRDIPLLSNPTNPTPYTPLQDPSPVYMR